VEKDCPHGVLIYTDANVLKRKKIFLKLS